MRVDYNKALNYTALLYAFLLPLSRAGISILTVLMILFWILEGDLKRKFSKILKCKFIVAILVFVAFSFISLFWVESENIHTALKYLKKYWYLLVMFVLYTSLQVSNISKILYAFLAGMSVSMVISWGIYFDWWQIKEVTKESLSPFMYHVFYSVFLAFAALLSIIFAKESEKKSLQLLYTTLTILFAGVLFLGIGRTGEVIFVIGLFLIFLRGYKHKLPMLIGLLLLVGTLFAGFYNFSDKFKTRANLVKSDIELLINKEQYCSSLGGRAFTWRVAYDITKEHPLLGVGVGDHLVYLKQEMNRDKEFSKCEVLKNMINYFHGQYIEVVAQNGFIGLILFLSIFYFLMSIKVKDDTFKNIRTLLVMTFLLFFIVDVPFRKQFGLALFALISSLILIQRRDDDKV
jgi:O-antigen ligase